MTYDLIIFDYDGVVADSEVLNSTVMAEQLAAIGLPTSLDDVLAAYTGKRWRDNRPDNPYLACLALADVIVVDAEPQPRLADRQGCRIEPLDHRRTVDPVRGLALRGGAKEGLCNPEQQGSHSDPACGRAAFCSEIHIVHPPVTASWRGCAGQFPEFRPSREVTLCHVQMHRRHQSPVIGRRHIALPPPAFVVRRSDP